MTSVQEYRMMSVNGFLIILTCSIIHGSQVHFNPSHYNKVRVGQVLEAKKVPTFSVCVYECMVTTDCQSLNYFMDERLCVFHSENSSSAPQRLFEATGRSRYSDISIWPKAVAGACSDIDCPPGQRCYPSEPTSICLETGTVDSCKSTFLSVGNDKLPDSALTASSTHHVAGHEPFRGRLNTTEYAGSWSTVTALSDQHWIQVDFQDLTIVRGVMTQGRHAVMQWVTEYKVLYSADCDTWTYLGGVGENATVFPGNSDPDTIVTNMFECPIITRHSRAATCNSVVGDLTFELIQALMAVLVACKNENDPIENAGMVNDRPIISLCGAFVTLKGS